MVILLAHSTYMRKCRAFTDSEKCVFVRRKCVQISVKIVDIKSPRLSFAMRGIFYILLSL